MKVLRCAVACIGLLAVVASPAKASIIFYGNQPGVVQPEENLLFNEPSLTLTGITVEGSTNTSHTRFDITGVEPLTADGGQAKVSGSAGTFVSLTLQPAEMETFFSEFEANLSVFHQRGPAPTGTVTVSTTNMRGAVATNSYAVGSGQNFFTLLATDPDLIRSVTVSSTVPLAHVEQIRVGGLIGPGQADQGKPVPEPGTLALFGVGLVAAGRLLRKV